MIDFDYLERLNAERTRTPQGWWSGDIYHCSFGPVGEPQSDERETMRLDGHEDGMMDVWAGDRSSEEDNRPLVCECGEPADARFIAVFANNADELLRLARIGAQAEARSKQEVDGQDE